MSRLGPSPQAEGGDGRRGNLGSSGPPPALSNHFPRLRAAEKGNPAATAPPPRAGTGSSPAAAQGPRGPRGGVLGARIPAPVSEAPAPHGPRALARGAGPRSSAPRARTHRPRSRATRAAAAGPRAPRSGRIVGERAQASVRRRLGLTSPKRGAGTSSRGQTPARPGPPRPARPAPRSAGSSPHAPTPHRPARRSAAPPSPPSLRMACADDGASGPPGRLSWYCGSWGCGRAPALLGRAGPALPLRGGVGWRLWGGRPHRLLAPLEGEAPWKGLSPVVSPGLALASLALGVLTCEIGLRARCHRARGLPKEGGSWASVPVMPGVLVLISGVAKCPCLRGLAESLSTPPVAPRCSTV